MHCTSFKAGRWKFDVSAMRKRVNCPRSPDAVPRKIGSKFGSQFASRDQVASHAVPFGTRVEL